MAVCYDLRFPELFRAMLDQGAELFCIPSAFTLTTGKAHWEELLRARAIENLSYVLAPNQYGKHPSGRKTYGHSMIVDPWGAVKQTLEKGSGILYADVSLDKLRALRKSFPCIDHRKLSCRFI
jgi:nitrilase